jgi:hypothetical protein
MWLGRQKCGFRHIFDEFVVAFYNFVVFSERGVSRGCTPGWHRAALLGLTIMPPCQWVTAGLSPQPVNEILNVGNKRDKRQTENAKRKTSTKQAQKSKEKQVNKDIVE